VPALEESIVTANPMGLVQCANCSKLSNNTLRFISEHDLCLHCLAQAMHQTRNQVHIIHPITKEERHFFVASQVESLF